jgi:thiaminase/transcriptional activator TenA
MSDLSWGEASFSGEAWSRNADLFETMRDMRFNADLMAGRLEIERFRHYIIQDAKYLIAFGQSLALASAKSDHPAHMVQFARGAIEAVMVERALHAEYFAAFGIDDAVVAQTPASPVCHHYSCFLLATGFREPLAVHLAAMLPCFWVYREVGRHIHAHAGADNPYRAWIDTYAGEEFAAAVDAVIATTDAVAAEAGEGLRPAMHAGFTRAMQLEWMFWDSAYDQRAWPL